MRRQHYSKSDIVNCLHQLGVKSGDILFSHVSLFNLGFSQSDPIENLITAIKDVIGETGSFLTPAFSYSFCKGTDYDIDLTPSTVGVFSNTLLTHYKMLRNRDPIFSLIGFGPHLKSLFNDLPNTSFGKGCVFEKLVNADAKICNFGLTLHYITPIHQLEFTCQVPYRYCKPFKGNIIKDGLKTPVTWEYYVRFLTEASNPNCTPLAQEGLKRGICCAARLGLGEVHVAPLKEYFALARERLKINPWFLVQGPAFDPQNLISAV